jgi:large subunit ribosomal protein L25
MAQETETLHAKERQATGTRACRRIRAQGEVPAVVYGHKEQTVMIQIPYEELETALRRHSRMVELHIGRKKEQVILKAVQHDAFGMDLVHADFQRVAMDEAIEIEVPILLKGAPKQEHAVLQQTLDSVLVECLPGNIPDNVVGQVAHLQIGETLHVSDLQVPEGIRLLTPPDAVVASVTAAKAEALETAPAAAEAVAAGPVEPEVIRREEKPAEEEEK